MKTLTRIHRRWKCKFQGVIKRRKYNEKFMVDSAWKIQKNSQRKY